MDKASNNSFGWQRVFLILLCLGLFHTVVYGSSNRLCINEIMASNSSASGINDPQGQFEDWIEIYNFTDGVIDIGGMYLTDDMDQPTKWRFPDDSPDETTVAAHGYLIVWADKDTDDGGLHADFKLDADGEQVCLFDRDGVTLMDRLVFDQQTVNISYGPSPVAPHELRYFALPTPGYANEAGYLGFVEDPIFSHERGFYDSPISVTIATVTKGAQIYYTTDGSDPIKEQSPSTTSTEYNGAIYIRSNTSLRATAVRADWLPSRTITHTYIFNANGVGGYDINEVKSMPVYSIVGDPETTFWGPDGLMSNFTGRGREYERPVSFEILDAQTGLNCQIDCGARLAGSSYHRNRYTVGDNWHGQAYNGNKIGFKLYFRGSYGDNQLDYPAFPLADTDKFKTIVIRSGFNDMDNPFIKDEWYRRLHKDMGGVAVTGTIVNFFLNGKFKSYYNPCERLDEKFFQNYYGVDTDWDVITHNGVRDGDMVEWNAAESFFRSHDMSDPANYAQAGEIIDIVNLIDYLIIEQFSGNTDWANSSYTNNWTASRERSPEGKWRFHCWDMELPVVPNATSGIPSVSARSEKWRLMFIKLNASPEFRLLFADRLQKHFFYDGALTQANLTKRYTELMEHMSQVLPNMNTSMLNNFIPGRSQTMLNYYASEGLFSGQGPDFQVNGMSQHGGTVSATDTITIARTGDPGTIYYTIDGTDPREGAAIQGGGNGTLLLVSDSTAKKASVPTGGIGTDWRGGNEPFDDSTWTSGASGVGYERSSGYDPYIGIDVESAMYNNNETCYVRIPFTVDGNDLASYGNLTLRVRYDDGFVTYINGTEVERINSPSNLMWNSGASGSHEASASWDSYDISDHIEILQTGTNILALHGMNISTTSSDFLVSAELEATKKVDIIDPGLSPNAIEYTSGFHLSHSTRLKSRVLLTSGQWSALHDAVYAVGPVAKSLRITEIMYHPKEADDPSQEYIELKNIGGSAINLNLVRFTKGINFTFPDMELTAGGVIVVVKDLNAFEAKYGLSRPVAGQYTGSLDNGGERLRLEDAAGTTIHDFQYSDDWYPATDGEGYSLVIIDPTHPDPNTWGQKDAWQVRQD